MSDACGYPGDDGPAPSAPGSRKAVRGLQERAARAFPAEQVQDAGGWQLRHSPGGAWWVSAVLPHAGGGAGSAGAQGRRGGGAAREVLAALAGWARAHAAGRMYLQVERDNGPALRLYERAGFREMCGYHYRTAG